MIDIAQMKQTVPLITCEIPFSQYVFYLMLGVDVTDLDLGSKLNLPNSQYRATLWFRETCLIVGLRPSIMIFITASLSSKTHNIALWPECVVFCGMWSLFVGMKKLVCLIGMVLCMFGLTKAGEFLRGSLVGPSVLFCRDWNTSINNSQRVKAGIPSMRKPASREKWSRLL